MKGLAWVRGFEPISFRKPSVFFVMGVRGSGKSSMLEYIGEQYLERGSAILDLFGSKDGEGLAWLRNPQIKDKRVLLLRGEAVDVQSSYDVKPASALSLQDLETYNLIVSSSPLYSNPEDEFQNAASITDRLYKRLHWNKLIYLIVREAANLYYSRLKLTNNQILAKSQMTYFLREMRHSGFSLALDTLRFYSIDVDIRNLSDYLILKSQGLGGLSRDLFWLYSIFKPEKLQNLPPNAYVMLTRKGNIAAGLFDEVSWHKREREDILKEVGIKCEYGEVINAGVDRGSFKTVSDQEHSSIVDLFINEKIGYVKIGRKVNRSSATIMNQVDAHNSAIERSGFCPACRRVKSNHEGLPAIRNEEWSKLK